MTASRRNWWRDSKWLREGAARLLGTFLIFPKGKSFRHVPHAFFPFLTRIDGIGSLDIKPLILGFSSRRTSKKQVVNGCGATSREPVLLSLQGLFLLYTMPGADFILYIYIYFKGLFIFLLAGERDTETTQVVGAVGRERQSQAESTVSAKWGSSQSPEIMT